MPTAVECAIVLGLVGTGACIATKAVKMIVGKKVPEKTQEPQNPQLKDMQGVKMRPQLQNDAFMRAAVAT